MKKGLILTAALCLLMTVSGCQTSQPSEEPSGEPVKGTTTDAETSGAATTTSALAVTDADGNVVTPQDGQIVTEIVTGFPTQIRTATERRATTTAPKKPGKDTAKPTDLPSSTSKAATTTTTTTREPTSTTATTQQSTETAPQPEPSDPWYAPYDLPQIYADCKREIERLGMTWEEGLRPDSLGVSWANPDNTVVYTYYPEMFHLREYVMDELIPEYRNMPYSRQSCRIWMEPYEESPGDYLIYYLERR